MAMSEHDIQARAMKAKGQVAAAKLDAACFGHPQGFANGGSVSPWDSMYAARKAAATPAPAPAAAPVAPPVAPAVPAAPVAPAAPAVPAVKPLPAVTTPGVGLPAATTTADIQFGRASTGSLAGGGSNSDWNVMADMQKKSPSGYPMADGGLIDEAIKAKRDRPSRLDAAEAAMVGGQPAPPAPAPAPKPAPKNAFDRVKAMFGMASGGAVRGPGGPTEDKIPAMLSDGEYVLPADTVAMIGKDKLDAIKNATHTPVKAARFGLANGGAYPETELEKARRISGLSNAQPAPAAATQAPKGPVNPSFTPNADGTMRPEQAKFQNAQLTSAREGILNEATGGPKGAEAAKVGRVQGAIDMVKGAPKAAAGLGRSALVGAAKLGAPVAVLQGGVSAATDSTAERDQFNAVTVPDRLKNDTAAELTADGLRALQRVGNAATFGYANQAGNALANVINGQPWDAKSDVRPGQPGVAGAVASTPNGAPGTQSPAAVAPPVDPVQAKAADELVKMGVSRAAQAGDAPSNEDNRRSWMQQGTKDYSNLGDFGTDGVKIFGRSSTGSGKMNDFAGVGTNVPQGPVTGFGGATAADVQAYKDSLAETGRQANAPQAPRMQTSGATLENQGAIAQLQQRLRGGVFTKAEGKDMRAQLKELSAQSGHLARADEVSNALAAKVYDTQMTEFGKGGKGTKAGKADGPSAFEVAKFGYQVDKDKAAAADGAAKEARGIEKDNEARLDKLADNAAGADKDLAARFKTIFATKTFTDNKTGKVRRFADLNDSELGMMLADVQNAAAFAGAGEKAGVGYSETEYDPTNPNAFTAAFGRAWQDKSLPNFTTKQIQNGKNGAYIDRPLSQKRIDAIKRRNPNFDKE